jgi:cytochrome c oxidase subunit 1
MIAVGGAIFIANVLRSRKAGPVADADPWEGSTLEWAAASPPARYNFVRLPVIGSRYPLWSPEEERAVVTGMRNDRREVLVTDFMDGEPQHRYVLPDSTIWPFLTALGLSIGLVGSVFQFSWYYVATALGTIGIIGWFWPRPPLELKP